MATFIHCNQCFTNPNMPNGSKEFVITTCFHVFCYQCISKAADGNSPNMKECCACHQMAGFVRINGKMDKRLQSYFKPMETVIAEQMTAVEKKLAFQQSLNESLLGHLTSQKAQLSQLKHFCQGNLQAKDSEISQLRRAIQEVESQLAASVRMKQDLTREVDLLRRTHNSTFGASSGFISNQSMAAREEDFSPQQTAGFGASFDNLINGMMDRGSTSGYSANTSMTSGTSVPNFPYPFPGMSRESSVAQQQEPVHNTARGVGIDVDFSPMSCQSASTATVPESNNSSFSDIVSTPKLLGLNKRNNHSETSMNPYMGLMGNRKSPAAGLSPAPMVVESSPMVRSVVQQPQSSSTPRQPSLAPTAAHIKSSLGRGRLTEMRSYHSPGVVASGRLLPRGFSPFKKTADRLDRSLYNRSRD